MPLDKGTSSLEISACAHVNACASLPHTPQHNANARTKKKESLSILLEPRASKKRLCRFLFVGIKGQFPLRAALESVAHQFSNKFVFESAKPVVYSVSAYIYVPDQVAAPGIEISMDDKNVLQTLTKG